MRRISSLSFSLAFLLISILPISDAKGSEEEHDSHSSVEGLMRGERLFYGLIDGKFESKACADCHNTVEIDTFNWNPNAWEIAHQYKERRLEEFQRAVLNPTGTTMSKMHQTFHLNESDVELIKLYLDNFEGSVAPEPLSSVLFLVGGASIAFIRKRKKALETKGKKG